MDGVRIGARIAKRVWRANETPELTLDLDNRTGKSVAVPVALYSEVEVDGVWHVPVISGPLPGAIVAYPAGRDRIAVIRLASKEWAVKEERAAGTDKGPAAPAGSARPLRLRPGKHTVRVACDIGGRRVVSNPVEIETAAPKR